MRSILVLLITTIVSVKSVGQNRYSFAIEKGMSCAKAIDKASARYDLLIAYSPSLAEVKCPLNKIIVAESLTDLVRKISYTFQLDYIDQGNKSYLLRSDGVSEAASEFIFLHIKVRNGLDAGPLAFASVYDESLKHFAYSDNFGDCFLRLPKDMIGKQLTIHSLGHEDQLITISGNDLFTDIQLKDKPLETWPVIIKSTSSSMLLNMNRSVYLPKVLMHELQLANVFGKDIMRSVQMLSGVNAINDSNANIRIRGSNEEATLLLLDNLPIYKADHFYGIFGAFNGEYIDDVSLFKNNIPVEYGGRTSGMLQLTTKNMVQEARTHIDLNLLNAGISTSIPLTPNLGLKLAGRKTYTNLVQSKLYDLSQRDNLATETNIKPQNIITSKPIFDFYDYNAKLMYHSSIHHWDFNLFNSVDEFTDNYETTFNQKFTTQTSELFNQTNNWRNTSFGTNYFIEKDRYKAGASLYKTSFSNSYSIESNVITKKDQKIIKDTLSASNDNLISDIGAKIYLQTKSRIKTISGIEIIRHRNELNIENKTRSIFEINRQRSEVNAFTEVAFGDKSKGLFVQPAMRATYLNSLEKVYLLPQLFVKYTINDHSLLKASAGKHVQVVRQFNHENILGQRQQFFALANGTSIPVGNAKNLMLGAWATKSMFSFDIEAYYRTLDGAIIHATLMPGVGNNTNNNQPDGGFRLFQGDSKVYGVDMSITYQKNGLHSVINYTLSKAENRFKEIFQNQYFPSIEDSRHQFKWINIYRYKAMELSLNYVGATGRPYLDLSVIKTPLDRNELDISTYIKKIDNYHRLDFGFAYNFSWRKNDVKLGVSVFNITNHTNVKYRQFVFSLPSDNQPNNPINTVLGSDVSQLDRTFNVSVGFTIK